MDDQGFIKGEDFFVTVLLGFYSDGSEFIKKKVSIDGACARCRVAEDSLYVLKDCQWVKQVWDMYDFKGKDGG